MIDPQHFDFRGLYLIVGLLILAVFFFIKYKKQQRRIHSGKELVHKAGRNEDGRWLIDLLFHAVQPNKWYRISAHFELAATSKEGFLERVDVTRHRFNLSLKDQAGGEIASETRPLQDFACFTLSSGTEKSSMTGARATQRFKGDGIPILEFIPPHPGDYRITFEVPAEEIIKDGSFEYISRIEHVALSVREDVEPMKSRGYPHKKLDLRQAAHQRL